MPSAAASQSSAWVSARQTPRSPSATTRSLPAWRAARSPPEPTAAPVASSRLSSPRSSARATTPRPILFTAPCSAKCEILSTNSGQTARPRPETTTLAATRTAAVSADATTKRRIAGVTTRVRSSSRSACPAQPIQKTPGNTRRSAAVVRKIAAPAWRLR